MGEAPCLRSQRKSVTEPELTTSPASQWLPPLMTTKGGSQDFSFPALTVPGSYIPSSAPGRTVPINNYSSCAQNNTGAPKPPLPHPGHP